MKNQTGMQSGQSFGRKNTAGKMMVKEEGKIREFPKQAIKTAEKGEKTDHPGGYGILSGRNRDGYESDQS